MSTSIGPRIGVDGYNEFKNQMDTIVSKLKTLENEAAALEKQYSGHTDSIEYLTKKSENYSKQLELQKQRLEESAKWTEKVTSYVDSKEQATSKDNLAVAKAEELQSKYNVGLQATEATLKSTNEQIDNYGKNLLESADAAEETEQRTSAVTVAIGNLISRIVEEAARLAKQMVQTGLDFNAQMESYKAGFTTLLGTEEAAGAALDKILETAKKAPTFSLEGLAEANRTLIAAGSSAEEANAQVLDLANALAAAGKGDAELARMALNLQQIANNGRAFAIDLKQFNSAGIPVWQILADYTGKTKDELSDTVITFEMLTGALKMAASEGGRYFGALDKQAATFNGQLNALKNNVRRELGQAFEGVTKVLEKTVLPTLNKLFESDESVYKLVTAIESVGAAIAVIGIEAKIAGALNSEAFAKAAAKVALYKASLDGGTISQAQFTSATSFSEIAVGLFTGTLSGAEAATWLLNTAMSALPFGLVAAGIALVVAGARKYKSAVEDVKNQNLMDFETAEEAQKHLDDLNDKLEQLESETHRTHTRDQLIEIAGLNQAIEETTEQVNSLRAAEQAAVEYTNSNEGRLNATVENAKSKISELYAAYDEAYVKAYEAAQKEFELFEYIKGVAYTSTQEMIKALDSQTLYWVNYAANLEIVRDANFGLSQELISFLSDGSKESAGYLQSIINDVNAAGGATSEGGQKIIQDINTSFSQLQNAQKEYADQTALTATDFETELNKTIEDAKNSLNELDLTEEMKTMAINDLVSFAGGMTSQSASLNAAAFTIGQNISVSLQNGINSVKVSLPTLTGGSTTVTGSGHVGEFATGLDYVPYDDFPAYLHKGEMVLTAADAAKYRSGGVTNNNSSSNSTVNNTVNVYGSEGQSTRELAREVAYEIQAMTERRERA